jgi:hypothetical protein
MTVSQRSFYHGAALYEITQDNHFTSINRLPNLDCSSAYQLNHDTGIYIKYATTGSNASWRFTFSPEHQREIRKIYDIFQNKTYIIFVCEDQGICIVDYGIFAACIDLNHRESEWIEIYRPDGGSFRIRGVNGDYSRAIPLNSFSKILFESIG